MIQTVALFIFALELPVKGLTASGSRAKTTAGHPAKA
jgi:uncharacterized membrane protein YfbV (UPF0208 family)